MKKEQSASRLEQQLRAARQERSDATADPALQAARTALKRYQTARLAATHADLLAAPDSHDAAVFFLEELYGAHDLSQRDADLDRVVPTMQRLLSDEALHAITDAIALDALSERLDTAMARELGTVFDEAAYRSAYRRVTGLAEREHQLDLVQELGETLSALAGMPLLGKTLAVMRIPARLAGLGDLQKFLERGYGAFSQMAQPKAFVQTVVERERALLAGLYGDQGAAPKP